MMESEKKNSYRARVTGPRHHSFGPWVRVGFRPRVRVRFMVGFLELGLGLGFGLGLGLELGLGLG